jgi:hypothetical protein
LFLGATQEKFCIGQKPGRNASQKDNFATSMAARSADNTFFLGVLLVVPEWSVKHAAAQCKSRVNTHCMGHLRRTTMTSQIWQTRRKSGAQSRGAKEETLSQPGRRDTRKPVLTDPLLTPQRFASRLRFAPEVVMADSNSKISLLARMPLPSVQLTKAGKVAVIRHSDSSQRFYLFGLIPLAGIFYTAMASRLVGGDYFAIINRIVEEWPF